MMDDERTRNVAAYRQEDVQPEVRTYAKPCSNG